MTKCLDKRKKLWIRDHSWSCCVLLLPAWPVLVFQRGQLTTIQACSKKIEVPKQRGYTCSSTCGQIHQNIFSPLLRSESTNSIVPPQSENTFTAWLIWVKLMRNPMCCHFYVGCLVFSLYILNRNPWPRIFMSWRPFSFS